jgi:ABC-2 type transport system ATP-binding protein
MEDDIAIKVDNLSKTFKLPHEKNDSIKSAIVNFYKRNKSYELQEAVKDVSFEIKKGEFFGIVGRNGSGKSTLLKILAGIYTPSKGSVTVNGKLIPFIELGVGFSPELTGRENVFLNGALLGFSRKEMQSMYKSIVEFAELERFMDQKLKNYSSGMQVRLAFSIAIRAESDVLVLDEVLAVGDADFQRKCLQYFTQLKLKKKTVVFVSHDMGSVRKYCDRVILIEKGNLKLSGTPQVVVPEFMSIFVENNKSEGSKNKAQEVDNELPLGLSSAVSTEDSALTIGKVWLEDEASKPIDMLKDNIPEYFVNFIIEAKSDVEGITPGVIVTNDLGEFVVATNSKWAGYDSKNIVNKKKYHVRFKMLNIYEQGDYKISVNVVSKDLETFYAWKNEVASVYVDKPYLTGAKANPKSKVEITEV